MKKILKFMIEASLFLSLWSSAWIVIALIYMVGYNSVSTAHISLSNALFEDYVFIVQYCIGWMLPMLIRDSKEYTCK